MYIVLGATGHVGSAVAQALMDNEAPVTVVLHSDAHAVDWRERGAAIAVVDINDRDALRAVFRTGTRAFLVNPPAPTDTDTDTDVEEHRTLTGIAAALEGSGLEKVVLESTYGAQPGKRIGDLSVLYDFEQALERQPIPATILRAAYYMSNWDAVLASARDGTLPSMFPADLKVPMVAPVDLGKVAARLPQEPPGHSQIHYVEGPDRYSAADVAHAFANMLRHPVEVAVTPRKDWEATYRKLGSSAAAADAYARMTAVSIDGGFEVPDEFEKGETTLQDYITASVAKSDRSASTN